MRVGEMIKLLRANTFLPWGHTLVPKTQARWLTTA